MCAAIIDRKDNGDGVIEVKLFKTVAYRIQIVKSIKKLIIFYSTTDLNHDII